MSAANFDAAEYRRLSTELVEFFRKSGLLVGDKSIAIQVMASVGNVHALHMEIVRSQEDIQWGYRDSESIAIRPDGAGLILQWPAKKQAPA